MTDSALDADPNEGYEYLRTSVGIEVVEANEYSVSVSLADANGLQIVGKRVNQSLTAGAAIVDVNLNGQAICAAQIDGPYAADIRIYDANDNLLTAGQYITNAYIADSFSKPPVLFNGQYSDTGIDYNSNGLYEHLKIQVELNVWQPGTYDLYGWLYDLSDAVIDTEIVTDINLPIGTATVDLLFEGVKIAQKRVDGPYILGYVGCKSSDPNSILVQQTNVYQTGIYFPSMFEPGLELLMNGDFSGNGIVDYWDLMILSGQWLQAPGIPSADIAPEGPDGIVNFLDFAAFAENWLSGI